MCLGFYAPPPEHVPHHSEAIWAQSPGVQPLAANPAGVEPLAALVCNPAGGQPLAPNPVGVHPLAANPAGGQPLAALTAAPASSSTNTTTTILVPAVEDTADETYLEVETTVRKKRKRKTTEK